MLVPDGPASRCRVVGVVFCGEDDTTGVFLAVFTPGSGQPACTGGATRVLGSRTNICGIAHIPDTIRLPRPAINIGILAGGS